MNGDLCVDSGKKCRPIFTQVGQQVIKLSAAELRLPARAWKVKLIGEGADDAGGVFDDTITEMCQVTHIVSKGLYHDGHKLYHDGHKP